MIFHVILDSLLGNWESKDIIFPIRETVKMTFLSHSTSVCDRKTLKIRLYINKAGKFGTIIGVRTRHLIYLNVLDKSLFNDNKNVPLQLGNRTV